jgi:hypothetical protein
LPTVTFTAALDATIVPRVTPSSLKIPFCPTKPPAMTPLSAVLSGIPFTVLFVTVTLLISPAFWPASVPTNWPALLKSGLAATLTLSSVKLRTMPVVPIAANSPMLLVPLSFGAMVRLPMVWPWPSSTPVKGAETLPIGAKFGKAVKSVMSLPSAYVRLRVPESVPISVRSLALLTSI